MAAGLKRRSLAPSNQWLAIAVVGRTVRSGALQLERACRGSTQAQWHDADPQVIQNLRNKWMMATSAPPAGLVYYYAVQ